MPNENRLSDIIADLLDPNGKHGQKEIFLTEFLQIIGKSKKCDASKGRIIREKNTDYILNPRRRIDIMIDFGNFGIGIENKPWAIDQKDQLKDYNQYLMRKYKDSYLLIYLTAAGSDPDSISKTEIEVLENQQKFLKMAYPDKFIKWLENCYKQSESEKIRIFLRDFINYINFEFKSIP